MKILLILVNTVMNASPLGLSYLKASVLHDPDLQERTDVDIKTFEGRSSELTILTHIINCNPQIIGFSCYEWNFHKIIFIINSLRQINKEIKIILGGPEVSPISELILDGNKNIDIIVRDEGEFTFIELIKTIISSGKSLDSVKGITYRDGEKIIKNPEREMIKALDSIPSPYTPKIYNRLNDKYILYESQRGCRFKCGFCYFHKNFRGVRAYSLDRVKNDLSYLLEQEAEWIYITDPMFNYDEARVKEICGFIADNNKNGLQLHLEMKAELVDEELADLLCRANAGRPGLISIGIETIDPAVLRRSARVKLEQEKFIKGVEILNKYKLGTAIHLISGLPDQTLSSYLISVKFVFSLKPMIFFSQPLTVLPGTYFWEKAEELQLIFRKDPPHYLLKNNTMSYDEMFETYEMQDSALSFYNLYKSQDSNVDALCKDWEVDFKKLLSIWKEWSENGGRKEFDNVQDEWTAFSKYIIDIKHDRNEKV